MSTPKPENHDKESFVDAFKSIPPIPKAKKEPDKVSPPVKPVEKPKSPSDAIDEAYRAALELNEKRKNDPAAHLNTLMQAIGFSSKELAMNREGEMSRQQGDRFSGRLLGLLILGGIMAFLVCITLGAAASNSPRFIVFMLAVFTGVVLVIGRSEIEARRKNFKGHVVSYTGRVRKIGTDKSFQLMVINYGDQTERIFVVGIGVYNAFVDGLTYTLYLPVGWEHHILSAEPVSDEAKWSL